ncbi:hypothetical protein [Rubrivirga sp.]|uniref:hypothetical protein n=1 Tax=Rubrivirga sp. TaxID=1885344 RepID=UPI003C70FEBF
MIRGATCLAIALAASVSAQVQPSSRAQGVVLEVGTAPVFVLEDERLAAAPSRPDGDEWIARDKALHLGGSFLLTLSGQYLLTDKTSLEDGDALPIAAASALALGLLKEVADSQRDQNPHFCWRDLAADAAGVALAAGVIAL